MINQIKRLPTPQELKNKYVLSSTAKHNLQFFREQVNDILSHRSHRKILIAGPCSIHDTTSALEYARNLKLLSEEVKETYLVLMRVYFEKARSGNDWKGLLHDASLNGSDDITEGLHTTRRLLCDLAELGIPIASELLSPASCVYFSDLLSWGSIGARTPESQVHRQFSSGLPFAMGFKNSTDGSLQGAIHAAKVASLPQSYIGMDEEGRVAEIVTQGNPYTHLVLRGGNEGPNHDTTSMSRALHLLEQSHLPLRIIVDCSHGNSFKNHLNQIPVFENIIDQILGGNQAIKGLMLESFLHEGKQSTPEKYGISITDSCLSWASTEELVLKTHKLLTHGFVGVES
jgi:3-deoxy-7-phosphoheptulonate synthase